MRWQPLIGRSAEVSRLRALTGPVIRYHDRFASDVAEKLDAEVLALLRRATGSPGLDFAREADLVYEVQ